MADERAQLLGVDGDVLGGHVLQGRARSAEQRDGADRGAPEDVQLLRDDELRGVLHEAAVRLLSLAHGDLIPLATTAQPVHQPH